MRHLGRRGMSVGEVAGTGQNETRGLSDVGEDGVMKGPRTSDRDVGAWIPVLHSQYWKAVLQPRRDGPGAALLPALWHQPRASAGSGHLQPGCPGSGGRMGKRGTAGK